MKTSAAIMILFTSLTLLAAPPPPMPDAKNALTGKVIETMDASSYTYVLVQQADRKTWVAARQFKVAVGDSVRVTDGQMMKDFESRTLKRKFDWILFASAVEVNGQAANAMPALPPGHPTVPGVSPAPPSDHGRSVSIEVKQGTVQKIPGGYTVEECYTQKKKLQGKTIQVRGVVVKFTPEIMNKNWVHLRDGTGTAGANDLAFTTAATVKAGDTVVLKGQLACDKDFGYGYKYAVLVEDAVVITP